MASLEVVETKVEPKYRRNNDEKGGTFKVGGRQFPMDFPLLKNQDPSAANLVDGQLNASKDLTKGNSLLNALKFRPGESNQIFGAEPLHSNIGHFDRMGTEFSGSANFLGSTMATLGASGITDLTSLLKPNPEQLESFGKGYGPVDQLFFRRDMDEYDHHFGGGQSEFIDPSKPFIPGHSHQMGAGMEHGYMNGHLRAGHIETGHQMQDGMYKAGKPGYMMGRDPAGGFGVTTHMHMLKKRKPQQVKKGEAVEISDVDEPPTRMKKTAPLHLAEAGPNLIGTGSRLSEVKRFLGPLGTDPSERNTSHISELHKMIGRNHAVHLLYSELQ